MPMLDIDPHVSKNLKASKKAYTKFVNPRKLLTLPTCITSILLITYAYAYAYAPLLLLKTLAQYMHPHKTTINIFGHNIDILVQERDFSNILQYWYFIELSQPFNKAIKSVTAEK